MTDKISIRFWHDHEVRATWDDEHNKRWFSVIDIIWALNQEYDYQKNRNYRKYLKTKLKKENTQLVSDTHQFKILAPDGKRRLTDMLDSEGVVQLAKVFPNTRATPFLDWFLYSDNSIDGQSKKKAYALFEGGLIDDIEIGTASWLQQIHAYLFGWLHNFAGQIRTKNISKGGFRFASAEFLERTLQTIEDMPQDTLEQIVSKYVEMNIAHPFMDGNGRATRIWLDLMLKTQLKQCVDRSKISKQDYMAAMIESPRNSAKITQLITHALTDQIYDREIYMKGIDYSYYYEEDS